MKKSLIALAVLAASGAAMAQSSVTLYGVADMGLVKSDGVSFQMSGSGVMNNGTSRLGVRGVEDLGGGLKASFNFEHGLSMEDGSGNKSGGQMWSRAAWMALQGGFGRVQMGRTLNPSLYGIAAWELTGAANYSATINQFMASMGGDVRDNSVLQYTFAANGFSGTLGYIFKPDRGGNAKYDLNAIYAQGPVVASFIYNKVNNAKGNYALGGSYDFGSFKVAASIQNPAGESKGFTLGATVPLGAFSVTADIARQNGDGMKNTDFLLEGKYALSKRTFAYVAYYKDGDANGAAAGGYATGAKSHFGVGVRHNF
ncbi:porin [Acidovorax sp. 210-6]|uniref:porin n=1 Tax=Acidovorax sp. 210-6 TaxID=2699468 RepID=UPI00138A4696|nr:porin [Acidovorax sp. 210-6]NCU67330.1 porin [Acidovorax sp. 210-6]